MRYSRLGLTRLLKALTQWDVVDLIRSIKSMGYVKGSMKNITSGMVIISVVSIFKPDSSPNLTVSSACMVKTPTTTKDLPLNRTVDHLATTESNKKLKTISQR